MHLMIDCRFRATDLLWCDVLCVVENAWIKVYSWIRMVFWARRQILTKLTLKALPWWEKCWRKFCTPNVIIFKERGWNVFFQLFFFSFSPNTNKNISIFFLVDCKKLRELWKFFGYFSPNYGFLKILNGILKKIRRYSLHFFEIKMCCSV